MDENFRKRIQKTLYSGQLESAQKPLTLTEVAVEFYQNLNPSEADLDQVDLETASQISSQETVSPASMVMSMIYARRLQRKRPDRSRKLTSSDLFLISMMMASKYLYDEGVDEEVFNDEWAENADMDKEEINKMEQDFLDALEWELFIRKEDFEQAMLSIEKSIAMKEGLSRGWFSYTDLCLLLEGPWRDLSLSGAAREWIKVILFSTAVYCMAVMSCALMITAGMTLASSALTTPTSLPEPQTPAAVSQCLSSEPSPSSCLGHQSSSEVPQPMTTAFRNNRTENTSEGGVSNSHLGKEEHSTVMEDTASGSSPTTNTDNALIEGESAATKLKASLSNREHSQITVDSVADAIISNLMALLTFKTHLVQFVYAVSESYTYTSQNLSTAKACDATAHKCEKSVTKYRNEQEDTNVESSNWFDEAVSSREQDAKHCLYCDRVLSVDKADLNKHGFSVLNFQQFCQKQGCKAAGLGAEKSGQCNRWKFQRDKQHPTSCQAEKDVAELHTSAQFVKRDMASVYHLFPDIIIGFSTSMPAPVYTT